jgi:aspartate carbamoyltransferase catalytic subunit
MVRDVLDRENPRSWWPHLLSARQFTRQNLEYLFEQAQKMRQQMCQCGGRTTYWNDPPTSLRGQTVIVFFEEPSTRTGLSFCLAAANLQGVPIYVPDAKQSSSLYKGETVESTCRMFRQNHPGAVVVRSSNPDFPWIAANLFEDYSGRNTRKRHYTVFISAGSGDQEHPTQALLDAFTIWEERGSLDDLELLIAGDVGHSRTINSLLHLLANCATGVTLKIATPVIQHSSGTFAYEPPAQIVSQLSERNIGVKLIQVRCHDEMADLAATVKYGYWTRPQVERFGTDLPSNLAEQIINIVQLTPEMLDGGLRAFHPLPHTTEVTEEAAWHENSQFEQQASNGVPCRMALLAACVNNSPELRR